MTELNLSSLRRIPRPPEGDDPITLTRRHPAALCGPIFLFAGALTVFIVSVNLKQVDLKYGAWVLFWWLASGALFIRLCWRINGWFTEYYMVTAKQIQHWSGTLQRKREDIPLPRVTDIRTHQSAFGRLLGFSHLTIESVCSDCLVWRFDYAPYPEQLLRKLREATFPDTYPPSVFPFQAASLRLPASFIRRANASCPPPLLAQLLRDEPGGEVRLKLYLTISLLAVSPANNIRPIPVHVRSWAAGLGLDGPAGNGARRVSDAIDQLAKRKLLVAERRQDTSRTVRLLSQDGTGDLYKPPASAGRYVRLSRRLWDDRWMARLSGPALALFIVLLDFHGGRAEPKLISPAQDLRRYDLSPDTWTNGIGELKALMLVTVSRESPSSRPLRGDMFYVAVKRSPLARLVGNAS